MKHLIDYLTEECAPVVGSGPATPANTMGIGSVEGGEHLEGIPVETIRVHRRKRKRKLKK